MIELSDDTLVYICNPEWCDDGYHVEEPEPFEAFWFQEDVEEFWGEDGHLLPLSQGELLTGYRMACHSWFIAKPEQMTIAEVKKRQGWSW